MKSNEIKKILVLQGDVELKTKQLEILFNNTVIEELRKIAKFTSTTTCNICILEEILKRIGEINK